MKWDYVTIYRVSNGYNVLADSFDYTPEARKQRACNNTRVAISLASALTEASTFLLDEGVAL
jgi:hypothetical protein